MNNVALDADCIRPTLIIASEKNLLIGDVYVTEDESCIDRPIQTNRPIYAYLTSRTVLRNVKL